MATPEAPGFHPLYIQVKDLYWRLRDDPAYTTPVRYELAEA